MAKAATKTVLDKISKGHLECPICCCRYKDPKILGCLHSFCLKCLDEMTSKQKPGTGKVTCPVCRRDTKIPNAGLQGLSGCFYLSSLVEEFNRQEKVLGEVSKPSLLCEQCEEGIIAVSRCLDCKENICRICWEAHQRWKLTKNHQIIEILNEVPKATVSKTKPGEPNTRKCSKHNDYAFCFYCEDCDVMICAMCAATEHRSGEHSFTEISDSVESFRENVHAKLQKFEQLKQQFESTEGSLNNARKRLQENMVRALNNISAKAEAEMAKIRTKVEILTEKVNIIGRDRDSEFENALTHIREQVECADQIVTAVNNLMHEADDFELMELKPKVMHNLELQTELKCEPVKYDQSFIGVKCHDVVSNDADLGEIFVKEKWQLKEEFGKEGTGEGEFSFARGVACFSNGDIVVTDTTLKRLTVFKSSGQYKTSVAQGDDQHHLKAPWGVAVSCNDLLYVTDKEKVKVFDNNLQPIRSFTTSREDSEGLSKSSNTGIAVDKQRLAVADRSRNTISVYGVDGSFVTCAINDNIDYYVAIGKNDSLIFAQYEGKKLLCIDFNGEEVFSVGVFFNSRPAKPTGVLCDDSGDIYVAVHSTKVGNCAVQHYDSSGAFVATVAEGLYNPIEMTFNHAGDVVVADRHSIKIFERM
ncbi:E3 ubiquitin-protein ligase TRIM71-like [Acanthaster planci]|uniref:E3 ubiquitin-protein ligase TRIM71-like n=1 Tax=Acanthaster planci TaxID=133434 RepID=A0A8B7Y6K7_ACAPL|nr:E3 ubiquitin-protein ligase TRIM71-like [Acanthaster planci]XP_022088845.1 E3 ubiquitin-protein ligase TRIM71-like [Acanthaster planci]